MTAEQRYVKTAIQPMISASYEAGIIDSRALHFLIASLDKREGIWEQEEFYSFFQQEKRRDVEINNIRTTLNVHT